MKGFDWHQGIKLKAFRALLLVLVVLWTGLAAAGYCFDNRKVHYASIAEARHAGELGDNRAIPASLLPDNATNIVLQYNLDTNERWLTYAFTAPQPVRLPGCTLDAARDIGPSLAPLWWMISVARVSKNAERYRCVDRTELPGYWVEYNCDLVQDNTRGAWRCDSGREIPK